MNVRLGYIHGTCAFGVFSQGQRIVSTVLLAGTFVLLQALAGHVALARSWMQALTTI
jgi:hypothetical protein